MKRWMRRGVIAVGLIVIALLAAFTAIGGWGLLQKPSARCCQSNANRSPHDAVRALSAAA